MEGQMELIAAALYGDEAASANLIRRFHFASAKIDVAVRGTVEPGADDYITKPFQYPELLARVRAGKRIVDTLFRVVGVSAVAPSPRIEVPGGTMRRSRMLVIALMTVCLISTPAWAVPTVDQQQPVFDAAVGAWAIGGPSAQKLAQTVRVGIAGLLTEIHIPVGCTDGTLIVEIVQLGGDRPGTRILGSTAVAAAGFSGRPADFRVIRLASPIRMRVDDRFAIVLRNVTGVCGLLKSPGGDTYLPGDAFFDARPNPPGWIPNRSFLPFYDLPFKTVVDVPSTPPGPRRPCSVTGFGVITFLPDWVPVCRCLQDPGLRSARCGLLHPEVFLFRGVPDPIPAGKAFKVRWTVMTLAPLTGTLRLTDELPAGFQTVLQGPLVFQLGKIPVGGSMTLEYSAIAGKNSGEFKVDTAIVLSTGNQKPDEGKMRTVIDVAPPK
jgi:CheY-like chemotaxis protein